MKKDVLRRILNTDAKVIIFDIDGTLKDLCSEHNIALRKTMETFKVERLRRRLILFINKIAMAIVKLGLFPTNKLNQNILIVLYAIISLKNIKAFYKKYYTNYTQELILFSGAKTLLSSLNETRQIFFATINKQNYNLEQCGIKQESINYSTSMFKIYTYSKLIKKLGVDKADVLIVGDNLFDDIISAKLLKVKGLLVNNYSSKLKTIFCKFLN